MTTATSLSNEVVGVPTVVVCESARALLRASQPAAARDLLDALDDENSPALALVRVELEIAVAYLCGSIPDITVLERAIPIISAWGTPEDAWDLELLAVRLDFIAQIFAPGTVLASMEGRDEARVASLRARIEDLQTASPDIRREGWADFYLGVVFDNLYGERHRAPVYYERCMQAAIETDDDVLLYEALRHLGDHRNEEGNPAVARAYWEQSAASAARAGALASTLAQQVLLAELARDRRDYPGAKMLAGEVARWAGSIGATRLRDQAEALLDSLPTTSDQSR